MAADSGQGGNRANSLLALSAAGLSVPDLKQSRASALGMSCQGEITQLDSAHVVLCAGLSWVDPALADCRKQVQLVRQCFLCTAVTWR